MAKNEKANVDVIVNGAQANSSVKEMEGNVRKLYAEWRKLPQGTKEANDKLKEYNKEAEKLSRIKAHVFTTRKSMDDLGGTLTTMAKKIGLLGLSWQIFNAVVLQGTKRAIEEEGAINKMTLALDGNEKAAKSLMKWKNQLMENTTFTEDEIMAAVNYGLALEKGDVESRRLAEAAMSLNKATGGLVSVQTALTQLNGTYQGDLGRLKKYTGDLTEEQLRNGEAIEVVLEKYGKFLTEGMDQTAGKVKIVKQIWEEFTESIGTWLISNKFAQDAMDYILGNAFDNIRARIRYLKRQLEDDYNSEESKKGFRTELWTLEAQLEIQKTWDEIDDKRESARKKNKADADADADEKKKQDEDALKNAEKYSAYLIKIEDKLQDTRISLIQDEKEKELKMAELQYQREVAQITGYSESENELRLALEAEYLAKRWEISEKYLKKEQEAREKAEKESLSKRFTKVDLTGTGYELQEDIDERLQMEHEAELMYLERTGQMTIDKRREILAQERDIALAGAASNSEEQLLIWEQYYAKLGQLNEDHVRDMIDAAAQIAGVIYSATEILLDSANERDQLELKQYEKNLDEKLQALEDAYEKGLISQDEYNEEVVEYEQELAEKRYAIAKKQADRELTLGLLMIAVKEGVAIANAIAVSTESSHHWVELIAAIATTVVEVVAEFVAASNAINQAKAYTQFASGRYDVIGASDGRTYQNVPYRGTATTGVVHGPALVSERGDELIIDGPTTRNLQMNYPDVIRAIQYARVPQHAEGSYSAMPSQTYVTSSTSEDELKKSIDTLNSILAVGIKAKMVWSEWESANNKIASTRNDVSID